MAIFPVRGVIQDESRSGCEDGRPVVHIREEEACMQITLGFDVGAHFHTVAAYSAAREPLLGPTKIPATQVGYEDVLQPILDRFTRQGHQVRCVVEAASHYWLPLYHYLRQRALPTLVINAIRTRYFAKQQLLRGKNDRVDARTIALYGVLHWDERLAAFDYIAQAQAKELTRMHHRLTDTIARHKRVLRRALDIVNPALPGLIYDIAAPIGLLLLERYPTARELAQADVDDLAALRTGPMSMHRIGQLKARRLIAAAHRTAAVTPLYDVLREQILLLVEIIRFLQTRLAALSAQLDEILAQYGVEHLVSIPGVGKATAATLAVEIGDIRRFASVDQLIAYAAVHPREHSSGRSGEIPGRHYYMSKLGNRLLKRTLYWVAVVAVRVNPTIRAYYQRKLSHGKSRMCALGHCMKKVLILIYSLWRSGQSYQVQGEVTTSA